MKTVPLQPICETKIGKTPLRAVSEYWGGELAVGHHQCLCERSNRHEDQRGDYKSRYRVERIETDSAGNTSLELQALAGEEDFCRLRSVHKRSNYCPLNS